MQTVSPYIELDLALRRRGYGKKDAAKAIKRSEAYLSLRFNCKHPFTLPDAYALLHLIGEPGEKMAFYFPEVELKK